MRAPCRAFLLGKTRTWALMASVVVAAAGVGTSHTLIPPPPSDMDLVTSWGHGKCDWIGNIRIKRAEFGTALVPSRC
eukprot:67191-Hanusia_phi.AAC.1